MSSDPRNPRLPGTAAEIIRRINASQRPLLVSHVRMDGDAIGAELGLLHILRGRGKRPHAVNDGPIPQIYRFLPGDEEVGVSPDALRDDYDLVIVLDTPTWARIGRIGEHLRKGLDSISIDHHPQVESFASAAWVDASFSSVGEMVYRLACEAGWPVPPEAATALYTALVTDTGRFRFPNTTPASLRAAADLIEAGAQHVYVCDQVYDECSPNVLALQADVVGTLRLYAEGRIAVMFLSREMMARHEVDPIDTQEFADYPRSVRGTRVGLLLREMRDGRVKVSLRSRSGVNIEPVARKFGGGGHKEASGCEVEGTLESVSERVVAEVEASLPGREEPGA